jgi:glycosyltransferase involved in cell wall biosynthesis
MQFLPELAAAGLEVDFSPFFDDAYVAGLVAGRKASVFTALRSYTRRTHVLLSARRYDVVWVHYEIFPYLPGIMEWLGRLINRPLIVDLDDATFHTYDSSRRWIVRRVLGRKLEPLLRGAAACCCGNAYLRDYAKRFCPNTVLLPTVVDTDRYFPADRPEAKPLVIGWIGSPSTWRFVRPFLPMLRRLINEYDVVFLAVGAGDAAELDRSPGIELEAWSEAGEVRAVQAMDIGIMPVPDGPFERGKCGYKLIQYMACGLPVVASPVGVNRRIVSPGQNGFLATTEAEWLSSLVRLVGDGDLRTRMGRNGRISAVRDYSLASQAGRLVKLFQSVNQAR